MAPSSTTSPKYVRPGSACPGLASKTRPSSSTTPLCLSPPITQPPNGCTVIIGPRGSFRLFCSWGGSNCQAGLGSSLPPIPPMPLLASSLVSWSCRPVQCVLSFSVGQSIRKAPSPSSSKGLRSVESTVCADSRCSRPPLSSWPIIATGKLCSMTWASTAQGSASCGVWSWVSQSPSACSTAAVVVISAKAWRSGPGTARSCTTKPPAPLRWSTITVMVGPTLRWSGRWSSSATAATSLCRPCSVAITSPLAEKRCPSSGDSARPWRAERSRISVDPSVPAASTTNRARSRSGRAWRSRSCSSVCCSTTAQWPSASRSTRSTVTPA